MARILQNYLLIILMISSLAGKAQVNLNGFELARKHSLKINKPVPDFFSGALLGNGGMGVVVNTRPDAIVLRFGHNNVWDIRIAENNREQLGTFQSVFEKVSKIPDTLASLNDDPWYRQYNAMAAENYGKEYPRPFPCGSLILGFDRRKLQLLGHELEISNGLCSIKLLTDQRKVLFLKLFTDMTTDQLWMELVDEKGVLQENLFKSVRLIPDSATPGNFPKYTTVENLDQGFMQFRQVLPQLPEKKEAEPDQSRAFILTLSVSQAMHKQKRMNWNGALEGMQTLEASLSDQKGFVACVTLTEGLNAAVSQLPVKPVQADHQQLQTSYGKNLQVWKAYWSKSAVDLADPFLESLWYRNLYFFNCATKPGVNCPGLFANWSYNNIGTAWHGDYHMNYNTQQPFWLTFSSNHLEKNLAYVSLVESLMPVSKKWAKEYYNLPGAYFPHSAYPVTMTMNPYPIPDWGWEVSETPWTVQGLWWHYLYSKDEAFLKNRAYEPIKAAVEFLTAYMMREDAHGAARWKDDKYHIFPSVPPELYGLQPGFKYNYDSSVDLSLTKFVFNAFKTMSKTLGRGKEEAALLLQIDQILSAYPDYPTATSAKYGKVLVSVPAEHDQVVYNVPNALFPVFPGEDMGLGSDASNLAMLRNTYSNQQNEGGNDLVFKNFQAARIGMLDIEEFKRQVDYCLLPNGTATDMVMQVGGRYGADSDYGYMSRMGIWFENFALPAVVNECLLQGYDGTIRLFPNWPANKDASFNNLRTVGAFLVSAVQKDRTVKRIEVVSEKGSDLHIKLPWSKSVYTIGGVRKTFVGKNLQLKTQAGQKIIFSPG